MKIIKKNGTLVDFDGQKIIDAIRKSAERAMVRLTKEQETEVVAEVAYQCSKYELLMQDDTPVAEVHKMVEKALRGIAPEVAEAYANYRNYKTTFVRMMDDVLKYQNEVLYLGDRSNANTDSSTVPTQAALIGDEVRKEFYNEFFLTPEEQQACKEGQIYVHDKNKRLLTYNCCIYDVEHLLENGFELANIPYTKPKHLDTAIGVLKDIIMTAGGSQYGGITIGQVDKILAPYCEMEYENKKKELLDSITLCCDTTNINIQKVEQIAKEAVQKTLRQGIQMMEYAFNTLSSNRGDYIFVTFTFGLEESEWGREVARAIMETRIGGQGAKDKKKPVLFPKLVYLHDKNKHGKDKPLRKDYEYAVYCQAHTMFPDLLSLTGFGTDGGTCDSYKKYGVAIQPMGCRSFISVLKDEDGNVMPCEGNFNLGVVSLNLPYIYQEAKIKEIDFYKHLDHFLDMAFKIHIRTRDFLGEKTASTNPLAFCYGGLAHSHLKPEDKIRPALEWATCSIGITALQELTLLHTGHGIAEDNTFAKEVIEHILQRVNECKHETGLRLGLYGTPAESLCGTQLQQFKREFGVIPGVSDKEWFTNSFHVAADEEINQFQKQSAEFELFHMINGGHIQYIRTDNVDNFEASLALADRAMEMGFYFGANINNCFCNDCGLNEPDMGDTCPHCGGHDITEINRVCGYLGYSRVKGDTRFNDAKLAEKKARKNW